MNTQIRTRIPMKVDEMVRSIDEAEQLALDSLTSHLTDLMRENPEKIFITRWLDPIYNPSRDCLEQVLEVEW